MFSFNFCITYNWHFNYCITEVCQFFIDKLHNEIKSSIFVKFDKDLKYLTRNSRESLLKKENATYAWKWNEDTGEINLNIEKLIASQS